MPKHIILQCVACGHGNWVYQLTAHSYACQRHGWNSDVVERTVGVATVGHGYGWEPSDTNGEGMTWPEWFYAAGFSGHGVDAGWTPVMTEHEAKFDAWKAGEDPCEWRAVA